MYSSHINFIFVSACYMLLVTDKSKYGATAATLLQKQLNTSNNQLILQFHKLMICTEGTQVQDLYLKNQLSRSYSKLKLIINKKIYKKIIQVFSSIKASKDWTIVKYLCNSATWALMMILVNTKKFVYISCNIVLSYFVYTCFENAIFPYLLYFLILCAELYVLLLQNKDTSSYFYKCVHIISFFYPLCTWRHK